MPEDEEVILPNKAWYEKISEDRGLTKECPYAYDAKCYCYWLSKCGLGVVDPMSYYAQEIKDYFESFIDDDFIQWDLHPPPNVEYMGPNNPRLYESICPEIASIVCYGLFICNITFINPALGEKSIIEKLDQDKLLWPNVSEDDPEYQKYINWLNKVRDFTPMHYSSCSGCWVLPEESPPKTIPENERADYELPIAPKESDDSKHIEVPVTNQPEEIIEHSDDFTWIKFPSQKLSLTFRQAEIVQYFYERHKEGTPQLSKDRVLENLGFKSKSLKDAFRSRKGAKNMLFESPYRGMYRLRIKITEDSR